VSDEKQVKVEKLELNKETIADLTEQEGEGVRGGGDWLLQSGNCLYRRTTSLACVGGNDTGVGTTDPRP
jgi:hypothetical protein